MDRHDLITKLHQDQQRRLKLKWWKVLTYLFLSVLIIITILPLVAVFFASLKGPMDTITTSTFAPPRIWQWGNYLEAWMIGKFSIYFFNTVVVATAVTILGIIFGLLVAYSLVILKVPFSSFWMLLLMAGLILPTESIIVTLYYNLHYLGLLNTHWALILPQTAMSISFAALFLRPSLQGIPVELLDSARIDGCNRFSLIGNVVLPLIKPALTSLVVLFFIGTWNEVLLPLILTYKNELRTLPLGLYYFKWQHTSNTTLQAAGTIIVSLPPILVYIMFQRTFIQGVTSGALKG